MTLKGAEFLVGFALPNFYFHATTAYDILRHCGVELGKRDFLGAAEPRADTPHRARGRLFRHYAGFAADAGIAARSVTCAVRPAWVSRQCTWPRWWVWWLNR